MKKNAGGIDKNGIKLYNVINAGFSAPNIIISPEYAKNFIKYILKISEAK